MTSNNKEDSGQTSEPKDVSYPRPERTDQGRERSDDVNDTDVKFVQKGISEDRLNALREFLRNATADDIATVRRVYGESPEVLKLIGIEVMPQDSELSREASTRTASDMKDHGDS